MLIINNIQSINQCELAIQVINHVKVTNSELNQLKGNIQAIEIDHIKKVNQSI